MGDIKEIVDTLSTENAKLRAEVETIKAATEMSIADLRGQLHKKELQNEGLRNALVKIRDYIIKIGPDEGPAPVYGIACAALALNDVALKPKEGLQTIDELLGECGECNALQDFCDEHKIEKRNDEDRCAVCGHDKKKGCPPDCRCAR
jgi:hypothetical protein